MAELKHRKRQCDPSNQLHPPPLQASACPAEVDLQSPAIFWSYKLPTQISFKSIKGFSSSKIFFQITD